MKILNYWFYTFTEWHCIYESVCLHPTHRTVYPLKAYHLKVTCFFNREKKMWPRYSTTSWEDRLVPGVLLWSASVLIFTSCLCFSKAVKAHRLPYSVVVDYAERVFSTWATCQVVLFSNQSETSSAWRCPHLISLQMPLLLSRIC